MDAHTCVNWAFYPYVILFCAMAIYSLRTLPTLGVSDGGGDGSYMGDGLVWSFPHETLPELDDLRRHWIQHFNAGDVTYDLESLPLHHVMREMMHRVPFRSQEDMDILTLLRKNRHTLQKDRNSKEWYQWGGNMCYRPFMENFSAKKVDYFDRWLESHGLHNSGFFYYPPRGYREWHTNAADTGQGWALYYVQVDRANGSWFHYVAPDRETIRKMPDQDGYYNLFQIQAQEPLFWHAVYSESAHRFSIGFMINDSYAEDIIQRVRHL